MDYEAGRQVLAGIQGFEAKIRLFGNSKKSALQPMRRFDFDCAIAFSDILTIPEALGFPYRFKDGGGITLERTVENAVDAAIDFPAQKVREKLGYVAENISLLRSSLPEKAAAFGLHQGVFSGSGAQGFHEPFKGVRTLAHKARKLRKGF